MNATLNYRSSTGDVFYSIESGPWCVDYTCLNPTSVRNEVGVTSFHVVLDGGSGDYLTVCVAKTDIADTYYRSQYHFSSGTFTTITDHNITTTITALS